jgi:hypothetical protein
MVVFAGSVGLISESVWPEIAKRADFGGGPRGWQRPARQRSPVADGSWSRLAHPVLVSMLLTWLSTVRVERNSRLAISVLLRPAFTTRLMVKDADVGSFLGGDDDDYAHREGADSNDFDHHRREQETPFDRVQLSRSA